ncbi:MAG: glycosyltransferase [Prevotellaceae bacterium]|jgi:glycosyltransferase involved in cell wall biosynthesis|nr:glycosyltransferase [Prevotellaceae bacterium]
MMNLSIIIPFYNCEKYFPKCLDSVLAQPCLPLEIILVNDGSNDGSEKIAEEYAKKDNRIILYNQENKGIPFARNKGLELASGEYFLFIDADDYIAPNTLYQLYRTAKENDLDVLQFPLIELRNDNKKRRPMFFVNQIMNGVDYFNIMMKKRVIPFAPYMNMVKMSFYKSVNFTFNEKLRRLQDLEFYTKLTIKANRIMNINVPYYYFRIDSNTVEKKVRHNKGFYYQCCCIVHDSFNSFINHEKLNKLTVSHLKWLICYFYSFSYNFDYKGSLKSAEQKQLRCFIRKYIFRNRGWMHPYAYYRLIRTFLP